MADEFWEKYKDPRWQEMRLRVMDREFFTCEICKSKSNTLHVDHGYYERDKDPWDYPEWSLHCYCDGCHKGVTEDRLELKKWISKLHPRQWESLLGHIKALISHEKPNETFTYSTYSECVAGGQSFAEVPGVYRIINDVKDPRLILNAYEFMDLVQGMEAEVA